MKKRGEGPPVRKAKGPGELLVSTWTKDKETLIYERKGPIENPPSDGQNQDPFTTGGTREEGGRLRDFDTGERPEGRHLASQAADEARG